MHQLRHSRVHAARIAALVSIVFHCSMVCCSMVCADVGDTHIATWKNNAKAAYSLTYDDSTHPCQEMMGNALTDRGLWGTFYVNPGLCWDSPSDDWDKPPKDVFIQFAAEGHELGSHTMWHQSLRWGEDRDYAFESEEAFRQDCVEIKAVLDQYNQKSTQSVAYPWGQINAASRAVVPEYFLAGRVSGCNVINGATPESMYYLRAWLCQTKTPLEALNARVFVTIADGGWGIEQYHELDETMELTAEVYLSHMDLVAAQVAENAIWNATVGDVTRYLHSRDAAAVELISIASEEIQLTVDDGLDDALFDVPLTVLTEIPEEWNDASQLFVYQGEKMSTARIVEEEGSLCALFEAAANAEPVCIRALFPSGLAGDLDGDGYVDSEDLGIIRSWWGEECVPGDLSRGDASGDGRTDSADLDIVRLHWQAQPTSVPEPSIVLLLLPAAALLITRRFRATPDMRS